MQRVLPMLFMLLALTITANAASDDFYPGARYNDQVPTPASFLGYKIGEYFTDHHQMEGYIHALEKAVPERVKIIPIGESYERRKMYLVVISAPENMRRLEDIRQAIAGLRDPRNVSPEQARRVARQTPVIAWMNYANDGNESAAFEACLQVAYHFAAGEDDETLRILKNAVIVLNPAHNPESHQRYVAWMKASIVGPKGTPDPFAAEHRGDWRMSTNNNHYQIDLNRDAFAATQKETQIIVEQMQRWCPQVFVDHHGETQEYFFAPYATPVNTNLPPTTKKWAELFGKNNASAFDKFGWTYFAREVFDLHYPGYWDSYPALNGAIGMTYETDGGGRKGLRFERADKTILTFRDGIQRHVVASITTIKTAAENRESLLLDYYEFFRTGMEEAKKENIKQIVLLPQKDPGRAADLVALLQRHRIEVFTTTKPIRAGNALDYLSGKMVSVSIPAGSYVVPLLQPQKRLAKALLQRDAPLEEAFLKEAREKYRYNQSVGEKAPKERLGFYDVTAWSLPLAYGVDAYGLTRPVAELKPVTDVPVVEGGIQATLGPANYGYAFSTATLAGTKLLAQLLMNDYKVAISRKELYIHDKRLPRGTAIVRTQRNPESMHDRIAVWSQLFQVPVYPLQSAWSDRGILLGSRNVVNLKKPKIAVITEEPVRQTSYGAIWYLFEKRYNIPFTAIRLAYFDRVDLYRYNVLIFPPGSAAGYERALGEAGIKKIKEWIQNGGVFIGIKEGAAFATRKKVGWTTASLLGAQSVSESETSRQAQYASAGAKETGTKPTDKQDKKEPKPDFTPGAIVKVELDTNHFLSFGYDKTVPVLIYSNMIFKPSREGANVGIFAKENVRISGFIWEKTEKRFPGNAYLIHEPLGRGKVILFADEPIFRLFWRGLEKLFLNSVLLGPSF